MKDKKFNSVIGNQLSYNLSEIDYNFGLSHREEKRERKLKRERNRVWRNTRGKQLLRFSAIPSSKTGVLKLDAIKKYKTIC